MPNAHLSHPRRATDARVSSHFCDSFHAAAVLSMRGSVSWGDDVSGGDARPGSTGEASPGSRTAILWLITMLLAVNNDVAVVGQPMGVGDQKTFPDIMGQGRGVAHVPVQSHFGIHFVDILASRSTRSRYSKSHLIEGDLDLRINNEHLSPTLLHYPIGLPYRENYAAAHNSWRFQSLAPLT